MRGRLSPRHRSVCSASPRGTSTPRGDGAASAVPACMPRGGMHTRTPRGTSVSSAHPYAFRAATPERSIAGPIGVIEAAHRVRAGCLRQRRGGHVQRGDPTRARVVDATQRARWVREWTNPRMEGNRGSVQHRDTLRPEHGGPCKVLATSLVSFPRAGKQAGALRHSLSPRGSFRAAPRGQRNCIFAMSGHHRRPGDAGLLSTTDANRAIGSREMPATACEAPGRRERTLAFADAWGWRTECRGRTCRRGGKARRCGAPVAGRPVPSRQRSEPSRLSAGRGCGNAPSAS